MSLLNFEFIHFRLIESAIQTSFTAEEAAKHQWRHTKTNVEFRSDVRLYGEHTDILEQILFLKYTFIEETLPENERSVGEMEFVFQHLVRVDEVEVKKKYHEIEKFLSVDAVREDCWPRMLNASLVAIKATGLFSPTIPTPNFEDEFERDSALRALQEDN